MIEFNSKTQQDFLNREWVERLLDAGVDMSDAKYYIVYDINEQRDYIRFGKQPLTFACTHIRQIPTYTVSELLYKLHEWIYPPIMSGEISKRRYTEGLVYAGGLRFIKDAPFYIWYYDLKAKIQDDKGNIIEERRKDDYIYAEAEYPIESLASLLIQCHKKDIGIEAKDTGDISSK